MKNREGKGEEALMLSKKYTFNFEREKKLEIDWCNLFKEKKLCFAL